MMLIRRLSLSTKIIFVSASLAGSFLFLSLSHLSRITQEEVVNTSLEKLSLELEATKAWVTTSVDFAAKRVVSLSTNPPIQGIIRSTGGENLDIVDLSTREQWIGRLTQIFLTEIDTAGIYDQLRYIDETGQEIVRVNFERGVAEAVSPEELQDKSDREYFVQAMKESVGGVYVSPAELNKEGNPPTIVEPYRPVLRIATPVFDSRTGDRRGIVVANILLGELLTKSIEASGPWGDVFVVDSRGYFIVHPDASKEWGGETDLATGFSFQDEFSNLGGGVEEFSNESGAILTDEYALSYISAPLLDGSAGEKWLLFVERMPSRFVNQLQDSTRKSLLFFGAIVFMISLFLFIFLVKLLFVPLHRSVKQLETALGVSRRKEVVSTKNEAQKITYIASMAKEEKVKNKKAKS